MSAGGQQARLEGAAMMPVGHEPALFEGHFPGHPILPGAKLLDMAIGMLRRHGVIAGGAVEIASVKFLSLVPPDSTVELRWSCAADGLCRFECLLGGQKVATGSLRAAA